MVDYTLSKKALDNLKLYKYASIDKSFISNHILRHYWNACTELFPLWIAPNLITLIGFSFVILSFLLSLIFTPNYDYKDPSWLFYFYAFSLWTYSTFDNVDGKQARRTGSSSPLGELFDHGCDALNCCFGAMVQASGLGLGYSWYSVSLLFITFTPFFFSTWETYHTGALYLGYINGPTEGLIMACVMLSMSGYFGKDLFFVSNVV
ncbi:hypothetical protein HK099_001750 [Clydaea vesicula]|uniref:Uncharacterized protein n=1 Tax=Clydaea vesicula TaxID=447962 RepID=A0AAD5XUW6_9FUNG|nr:hypothetical protein HK099_001750 [Clydaea vesicula]